MPLCFCAPTQDASRCKNLIDAFDKRMEQVKEDSAFVGGSAGLEMTSKEKALAIREFIRVR